MTSIDGWTDALVEEIEGWSDMLHVHVHYADDGEGHRDFMGISVRPEGRERLRALIERLENAEKET
jgi:hypothetical protein